MNRTSSMIWMCFKYHHLSLPPGKHVGEILLLCHIPILVVPLTPLFRFPSLIEEVPMNILYERCAGLDVHKKSIVACLIIRDARGHQHKEKVAFSTMLADLY